MKSVIVIGLGSMGCRRIRLLKRLCPGIQIGGIDVQQERRKRAEQEFDIPTFLSINDAVLALAPFAGFVCTSPLSHYQIIMELLKIPMHVFTELNLIADGYQEMILLAKKQMVTLFLSSTFLYRKDVQYLIQRSREEPVNYCIHTGQYLPDWHPWENYQDYFVGNKRTNGCREIFAVDLPWVLSAFGEVKSIFVMKDKLSSLQIDYPDNYIVFMNHKNGSKGVFYCDIVSRKGGRRAEIFSEHLFLTWEGTPDSLHVYDLNKHIMQYVETYQRETEHLDLYKNMSIIEDAYMTEIAVFFRKLQFFYRYRSICKNGFFNKKATAMVFSF